MAEETPFFLLSPEEKRARREGTDPNETPFFLLSPAEKNARRAKEEAQKKAAAEEEQKKKKFPYTIGTGTRYPILSKYLKTNFKNDVLKSPRILQKMAAFSSGKPDIAGEELRLLEEKMTPMIEKAVTYHYPPKSDKSYKYLPQIVIDEFPSQLQGGAYLNKVITIGSHIADTLEEAEDKEAALYIVFAILCHEITHYLDWLIDDNPIEGEVGSDFELAVFQPIWGTVGGETGWQNGFDYKTTTTECLFDRKTSLENARLQIDTHNKYEESKNLVPTLPL